MPKSISILAVFAAAVLAAPQAHGAAASWTKRMYDAGNTGNVGDDPALVADTATKLLEVEVLRTTGEVNATPVVTEDGLVMVGDGGIDGGAFYVFDVSAVLENPVTGSARTLVRHDTGATVSTPLIGNGVQAAALIAAVTTPGGEEERVYFGANKKPRSFWCLSLDRIREDREALASASSPSDGEAYFCEGAAWPIPIMGLGVEEDGLTAPFPVYNGSPVFGKAQEVVTAAGPAARDVVYTPTIGADCSDGQFWALDAYTGELYWRYDPVPNFQNLVPGVGDVRETAGWAPASVGYGGVIWTNPAVSSDGETIYVTTGDCVEQPQVGFQAESLVALDAGDGSVKWHHQRRLVDTSDYDIGTSPVLVDVPGEDGCRVVVSTDKNGCVYGFPQVADVPQVGEPGFDPLRPGQQRNLWRTCLVPGSLNGGFNASAPVARGRWVFAQASSLLPRAPGDNAHAFVLDACTGELAKATADVGSGRGEGAIVSDLWLQPAQGERDLQVFRADRDAELLGSVGMTIDATAGGGGPAVVDGTIYVPGSQGVSVIRAFPTHPGELSPPKPGPATSFGGPYPVPIGYGIETPMPIDPYDPKSPLSSDVDDWPTMNP